MARFIVFISILFSATVSADSFTKSWAEDVIYFLIVDRFEDGDSSNNYVIDKNKNLSYHGGDLKGIVDRYSHFDQLGITTLLYSPLLDNRDRTFFGHWAFHGYWPKDHFMLDEHFGNPADYKRNAKERSKGKISQINDRYLTSLNSEMKKRGHKVILDLVLNHVDYDHPWYTSKKNWFHKLESITDWNDPIQLTKGKVSGLPDLDQDNPEVYKFLMDYSKFWIKNIDADGIRADAVKHIGHTYWKRFIAELKEYTASIGKHDFLFLAENLHGDPNSFAPLIEDGFNAFDDFPLYYTLTDVFAKGHSLKKIPARLQYEAKVFPKNVILKTFIDNHDVARFLSINKSVSVDQMHQALALIFMVRGVPAIYYGTESHLLGESGEDGRKDMIFKNMPSFEFIKKLVSLRKKWKSLSLGIREDYSVEDNHYIFFKNLKKEQTLSVFTGGKDESITIDLVSPLKDSNELVNFVNGKKYKVVNGKLKIDAKKHSVFLFGSVTNRNDRFFQLKKIPLKEVVINFSGVESLKDSDLFLVGNDKVIGDWDTNKAISLSKDNMFHIKLPRNTLLEAKLILKNRKTGKVTWEKLPYGVNRYIFFNSNKKIFFRWGEL